MRYESPLLRGFFYFCYMSWTGELQKKMAGWYINTLSWVAPTYAARLAFSLFSNPRDGRLNADALPECLSEAKQSTLSFSNYEIQTYEWEAEGPRILLVHGWESNASRWELLLPYLKGKAHVIALDGPSHGLSKGRFNLFNYAQCIDEVVRKYQPQVLIGHSLGGATSVYYQHQYQASSIERMAVLGAPAEMRLLLDYYANLIGLSVRAQKLLMRYMQAKFKVDPQVFSSQAFTADFGIEGFIAHDELDELIPVQQAEKTAGTWKKVQLHYTKGFGHALHSEEMYAHLQRFVLQYR